MAELQEYVVRDAGEMGLIERLRFRRTFAMIRDA